MNDEAVQVLKEAMEPPSWWTNSARPTAREVARRLEELGYTVARASEVKASPRVAAERDQAPRPGQPAATGEPHLRRSADAQRDPLSALMSDLERSVAAVHESNDATGDASRHRESA